MSQHDTPDPFTDLQEWAKKTERRVHRERRRRLLAGRLPVVLVAVLALVAVALAVPAMRAMMPGDEPAEYPTQRAADGVSATTSASAAPTDPFAGTPAAAYPKGEAGITLPAAKAVPGFTAKQVDAALRQVRQAMIAGRLDAGMLTGHDPEPFLTLLAPSQRAAIRKWFTKREFDTVATWIDPAVRLDPREQPRVSGRVTYASMLRDGRRELRVTTNFVWVYAFVGTERSLAVEHDEIQWGFPSTKNLRAADRGMWIGSTKGYVAWVDCAAAARGLLAPTRVGAAPDPARTEDPNAMLRPDHTLDIRGNCP